MSTAPEAIDNTRQAALLRAARNALEFMRSAVQQGVRIKGFDVDENGDVKALKAALESFGVDCTKTQEYECGTGQEEEDDRAWLEAMEESDA